MNITLPETIKVRGAALNKAEIDVETSAFSTEFVVNAIQYMWDVRVQRCQSKVDKDHPTKESEKAKMRKEMVDALTKGEIPSAKAATHSPENTVWIEYFNKQGLKEGGKVIGPRNLHRAQETAARKKLLADNPAGTGEGETIRQNIEAAVTGYLPIYIKEMEETVPFKLGIDYHKAIAAMG